MDLKTFDRRNKKLENDSRLLPKEVWSLNFLLSCNYDKGILTFFQRIKNSLQLRRNARYDST